MSSRNGERQSIFIMLNQLQEQLDHSSVVELIDLYLENSERHLAAISAAIQSGDLKKMSFEAHGLKSSSANLGASELSQACLKVEKAAAINQETLESVGEIERLFREAAAVLRDWKLSSR